MSRKTYPDRFVVWERWFAWHPIWIGLTRVWWEPVERRLRMYGYDSIWEYRLPEDKN